MEKIKKYERQNQILLKLQNNPGVTQLELSKFLNVHKATISRDFIDLSIKGALVESDTGLISLNPNYFLDDIQFTQNEAFSLYISAVLMADRSDFGNNELVSALRKLSLTLEKSQPHLFSLFNDVAKDNELKTEDELYTINLDKIITAWVTGQQLEIEYYSRQKDQIEKGNIAVLDFTPYADGHGNHLIGLNIKTKKIKPYRFKRIRSIKLSIKKYNCTNRTELLKCFENSWKIWLSDTAPKEVILHFKKEVAKRVLETKWHKNQITELQDDGTLLWKCKIAEPKEMEYWILGWGSNVTVLQPTQLKENIKEEIRKLLINYDLVAENATVVG